MPTKFLYNLTKNLTVFLPHNLCAVLPINKSKKRTSFDVRFSSENQSDIPVRLTKELQSVHSGTVGLSSCVPTEIQSSEQKSSVTRLFWHCDTVHLMLQFFFLQFILKISLWNFGVFSPKILCSDKDRLFTRNFNRKCRTFSKLAFNTDTSAHLHNRMLYY